MHLPRLSWTSPPEHSHTHTPKTWEEVSRDKELLIESKGSPRENPFPLWLEKDPETSKKKEEESIGLLLVGLDYNSYWKMGERRRLCCL